MNPPARDPDPEESLLFAGPLGAMKVEDVLQFVAQAGVRAQVAFTTEDRVHGWPRAVDLVIEDGCLVGLGPRGLGLRLGDLAVARGATARGVLEAVAAHGPPGRLGERLAAAGHLAAGTLDDLVWERHARVVWGLLTWDRGQFRCLAAAPGLAAGAVAVDPPLPLAGLLLDGLQRAESARFEEAGFAAGPAAGAGAGAEDDPGAP
jgi:hypothetical protein